MRTDEQIAANVPGVTVEQVAGVRADLAAHPLTDDERAAIEAWPWTPIGEGPLPSRPTPPCGGMCGPEGCMARGCPVAGPGWAG